MVTRIQIAKPDIVKTFEAMPRVLKAVEVAAAFENNREFWRLTKSTSLASFTRFLVEKTQLKHVRFNFPNRPLSGFVWGDAPLLDILLGLADDSYLSHYSAVRIHGLTEQVPKTIYLSREKPSSSTFYSEHDDDEPFDQAAIDAAFSQPPRISQNAVAHDDVRIVYLQGAYHGNLGVTTGNVNLGGDQPLELRFTNLERTLIDIVVRPFYAGGVFEVAKAFENARDKGVSVNAMASMLKRMRFGYPYHQAIGYYLERAGYKPSLISLFRREPMERDFYLTHEMGETSYVKGWRLHIPQGF